MAVPSPKIHDRCQCRVESDITEIDAGCPVTVHVAAACAEGCDLGGQVVSIRDRDGIEMASGVLASGEDDAASVELSFAAPLAAGAHDYVAVLAETSNNGVVHRAPPAAFTVDAREHQTSVNAWDLPSAVAVGEPFRFKVGVRCTAGCNAAGRPVAVRDAEGNEVAAGVLGDGIWPGTTALHYLEMAAAGPSETGAHLWQIEVPASADGAPHAAGSAAVTLNVVPRPEFEVTIETVDSANQTPVRGARVVMHPYRATSDESGIARLRVARGDYTVLVSGRKHMPVRNRLEVNGNLTTRAELEPEPPPFDPDEGYY